MEKLNIAYGLRRLNVVKGRLGECVARAKSVFAYREDAKPAFDFNDLSAESDGLREELITLKASIARANATAQIQHKGKSMVLCEAILRLAELKDQIATTKSLTVRTAPETQRENVYNPKSGEHSVEKRELKWSSALSEAEKLAKVRALEDEFQELNMVVETANHVTSIDWSPPTA